MHGTEGEYKWADRLGPPWKVVKHTPSIVLGKRVVVTAFDFGPARVSEEEALRGWHQGGAVLITSPVTSYDDIVDALSDEGGEIWVFDPSEPIPDFDGWEHTARWSRVVNFAPPAHEFPAPPPSWDCSLVEQDREWLASVQEQVRRGLARFRPLSFLRDDLLVSRDPDVLARFDALVATAGCGEGEA